MATSKAEKFFATDLKNWLETNIYTVMASTTIKDTKTGTATFTKAGYFPLAIVGHYCSSTQCRLSRIYISARSSGSVTIAYGVTPFWINNDTGTTTDVRADVLWLKMI